MFGSSRFVRLAFACKTFVLNQDKQKQKELFQTEVKGPSKAMYVKGRRALLCVTCSANTL
jgi:hypothetical protein